MKPCFTMFFLLPPNGLMFIHCMKALIHTHIGTVYPKFCPELGQKTFLTTSGPHVEGHKSCHVISWHKSAFLSNNQQRTVLGGAPHSINVLPSGKHTKKRWKITRFELRTSNISMAIFIHFLCRKLLNYQRVIDVEISTKDQKPCSTDNS